MAAPIFLTEEQLVTILMQEMPQGVYADDRADDPNPVNRSYSSSEIRAHARLLAQAYANLAGIYSDENISTVTPDGLAQWEMELFATAQDSSQPYSVRQANLLAKYRAAGGINFAAINSLVGSVLNPLGLPYEIVTWNGLVGNGAWVLDYSELDQGTYLSFLDPIVGQRLDLTPLDCSLNYSAAGLTAQQLADIQATAYTYEVRIFGVADATTLARLNLLLTEFEPARSTHVIINNDTNPM
jgi:hypothetical protein